MANQGKKGVTFIRLQISLEIPEKIEKPELSSTIKSLFLHQMKVNSLIFLYFLSIFSRFTMLCSSLHVSVTFFSTIYPFSFTRFPIYFFKYYVNHSFQYKNSLDATDSDKAFILVKPLHIKTLYINEFNLSSYKE